jgi:hypothetical protein
MISNTPSASQTLDQVRGMSGAFLVAEISTSHLRWL